MSVVTQADEHRQKAKEHVSEAYRHLHKMLDPDTWGHDEWSDEFVEEIVRMRNDLLRMKRIL